MTDISNWAYVYKTKNNRSLATNVLYTPRINSDRTVLCMSWDINSPYQQNPNLTDELMEFFFQREIQYLSLFQKEQWCPKLLEIENKNIFIEWNNYSLNSIIYDHENLDYVLPDWKEQLFQILKDVDRLGFYKLTLYPHCFYIDKNNCLKMIDFYACIEKENPYIQRSLIEGVIGTESIGFFNDATDNGIIDFSIFFKSTLITRLSTSWPDNPFPNFYDILCTK